MISPELKSALLSAARSADSPAARAAVIAEWSALVGHSESTIRRWISSAGILPTKLSRGGRRPASAVSDETIARLAAQIHRAQSERGKDEMPYEIALSTGVRRGLVSAGQLSLHQFKYRLKKLGLLKRDIFAPAPFLARRSDHPNQLHQMDWSACIQWDFGDRGRPMEFLSYKQQL